MRFAILYTLLFLTLAVPNLHAQSNQLEKSQMGVVRFDVNMDQIRNSVIATKLGLQGRVKTIIPSSIKIDPESIKRVSGASSLPESVEAAQAYKAGEGPMPFEFFAAIELVDSQATDDAMKQLQEDGEAVDIGGRTYYKVKDQGSNESLLGHRVDGATIEVGTKAYILRADRAMYSEGLKTAWEKTPKEAVRIAMDLESASVFVAEFQKMISAKGDPSYAAFYQLIGAISDMHITMEMDGENLVTIGITGKSESEAEDIEGGINSLLVFGKFMGMGMVGQLKQKSPELGDMVGGMLEALKAEREADSVQIKLIHPEGLADAIKAARAE